MSPEENKAIVLHLLDEVFTRKNPDAFLEYLAPNAVFHLSSYPTFHGPEAVAKWATTYLAAIDARVTVDDMVAEGDIVMLRWTTNAIHKGEYVGIPATGRPVSFTELALMRFAGDKAEEVWIVLDTLDVMQQLGLFPKGHPPRALMWLVVRLQRLGRSGRKARRDPA
jgi:predicted ester cyclase